MKRSRYDQALADERRALIARSPVDLIERDGRVWRLVRLPAGEWFIASAGS